jgi:uncharacterized protein YndB with AHSA1/START domain
MASNNKTQIIAEPGKQEIFVIREFDAPRELVFRAFSEKELLTKWIGPRDLETRYEKFEPFAGGSYRFVQSKDGMEFAFNGVCHEFTKPTRIIQTFEFEGLPERGHVVLETSLFEELPDGRTRLTSQSVFQSVADRDGMVASGMEHGVIDSYERLDELIAGGILE